MGFRTHCSGNNTYLICTLGRRDKISYAQLDMFKNEIYKEYFIIPMCTKNGTTTKISFDISGLTSLSEYIKTRMEQEQYFEIIAGIQKIASFCKSASLPFENLICDPKYMYYDNADKKILMAFLPMQSPKAVSMDIPECLLKLHKSAKDIIIKDGNYMGKYEEYLSRFQGKKSKAQTFSPDALQHFFNENETQKSVQEHRQMPKNPSNIVYVNDSKFDINRQIDNNNTAQPVKPHTETTNPLGQFEPVKPAEQPADTPKTPPAPESQPVYKGGTYVPPREDDILPDEEPSRNVSSNEMFDAYLIAPDGKKIYIEEFPFTIGREPPKSLVINENTVSGNHAEIKKEYNLYYLVNWSKSNGTFINENFNKRIQTSVQINDGDRLYFYRTCYTFHLVKKTEPVQQHTVIVQQPAQHTFIVGQSQETRALAYIRKVSDNSTLRVMKYPFTDDSIYGVVFSMESFNGRMALFMENTACYSLKLENVNINIGMKTEIFSGCSLFINGEKYTFIIEN